MATAFWIATENYIQEAAASAKSLRAHMPDVARELWTPARIPQETRNPAFDRIRFVPPRRSEFWFVDAVYYFTLAVGGLQDERLLYLDTDTHVCADLSDVFKMLDRFDFVGAHAPGRMTAPGANGVPPAFPELNVGVNGIRRSQQVRHVLQDWFKRLEANPQNNDQPALRAALWESDLRVGILPPEYNMRWGFGGFARYAVKVLHGRPENGMSYQDVERRINARKEMRGWERGKLP